MQSFRWLGIGLAGLGVGLVINSLLGPLAGDVIRYHYHFSETLQNQGIGLDAVSLALVAPLSLGPAILAFRSHPSAPVLALGPAIYTMYMSVQYVVGPEYLVLPGNNEQFFLFHVGLFILGGMIALRAWTGFTTDGLPPQTRNAKRALGGF
jgi:hypothetical protein